jgi:ABC-type transport system involved in multi-copper enzyme maturation permease subunit
MTTATVAPSGAASSTLPPAKGRAGLGGSLLSEWTKIRSVRSTVWSIVALVGISVGMVSLFLSLRIGDWNNMSHARQQDLLSDPLGNIFTIAIGLGQLAIVILGVMTVSSEYTTGMIRSTLQAQPRRGRVFAAKIMVFSGLALVVGQVVAFGSFFASQFIVRAHVPMSLSTSGYLRSVVGAGLYLAVIGLFSLAFGMILRHTAGAITAVVGILIVLSGLTELLPDSWGAHVHAWWPSIAGSLVYEPNVDPGSLLTPWQGFGVLLGETVLLLGIAYALMRKRDA